MRKLKGAHLAVLAVFLCAAALFAGVHGNSAGKRCGLHAHTAGFSAPEGVPSLVVQFEGVLNVWLDPESLELLRIGNG